MHLGLLLFVDNEKEVKVLHLGFLLFLSSFFCQGVSLIWPFPSHLLKYCPSFLFSIVWMNKDSGKLDCFCVLVCPIKFFFCYLEEEKKSPSLLWCTANKKCHPVQYYSPILILQPKSCTASMTNQSVLLLFSIAKLLSGQ